MDNQTISQALSQVKHLNYLAIIVEKDKPKKLRSRRIRDTSNTGETPILYATAEYEAMVYSSNLPSLKGHTLSADLGPASTVTIDRRGNIMRLLINIPMTNNTKLQLQLYFTWELDNWIVDSLQLQWTENKFNMTPERPIRASRHFSYHCTGSTVFNTKEKDATLTFYDLQLQPDAFRKFGPAYDCTTFMTAPIWSGLFVTSLLLIVLFIGFAALGDIKTMDKFDTNKQRALTIATD